MDIVFIVDPLASLNPDKDSSIEMMHAAARRGHALFAIESGELHLKENQIWARAWPLTLTEVPSWYHCGEPVQRPLHDFGAVMMRKDPPFDMEYVFATYLLELAEQQGAQVFNRPQALRDFNEKLSTARFPELTPPLMVSRHQQTLREFIREQGDVILKPLDGMGGSEIFRVQPLDPNLGVILETMTRHNQRTIMAQRYLPAITQGDKRVLVVDGKPMPYCLARMPAPGETRGNLAAGGSGHAQPLSERDLVIAKTVAPVLKQAGLLLVGLDIIGDYLTEINVTSPTCMREIRDQTGWDTAGAVIEALERAVSGA
ncbi:MAG: glutathione synthase [Burkholderiales bacterium]